MASELTDSIASATAKALAPAVPCRLCGSRRLAARFPRAGLPVARCLTCGGVFRTVAMSDAELAALYNEDYYLKTWPGSLGRFFGDFDPDRHHKTRFFARQLKYAAQLAGGAGRLLDVGCGNGVFVWQAREAGWEAEGVEISRFAAEQGSQRFGVTIHQRRIEDLAPAPVYDVITFWDSIEHMPEPKSALTAAFTRLKPGGYLAVLTPDGQSLVNQLVHAAHRIAPRRTGGLLERLYHPDHLTYFDRDSLALNLIEHGFLIHWIESYDEHPRDTETRGFTRLAVFALYPLAALLQLKHEMLIWAKKPKPYIPPGLAG
jgi:SAM-dependent methyltransferase